MERFRKYGRININIGEMDGSIEKVEKHLEGAREKAWFNKYKFLFKKIYPGTYEDYAELISSEIAKSLCIPCAEYDLALYNGEYGVITYNFLNEEEGEELISGNDILYEVYNKHILPIKILSDAFNEKINSTEMPTFEEKRKILHDALGRLERYNIGFDKDKFLRSKKVDDLENVELNKLYLKITDIFKELSQSYDISIFSGKIEDMKMNNLFDLWSVLENFCRIKGIEDYKNQSNILIKDLSQIFLYDILTLQGDRHQSNWSVIYNKNKNTIRLAPLYDNSNMCNLNRIKGIRSVNEKVQSLKKKGRSEKKIESITKELLEQIYHPRSLLGVNPENREKNLTIIEQFINISSSDSLDSLIEKMNNITENDLQNIYQNIENKIKSKIPDEVKDIVTTSISLNIREINKLINSKGGILNGR